MLELQAYDYAVEEVKSRSGSRVNVLAWCLDKSSQPHLLRVPYYYVCYMELRPLIAGRAKTSWTKELADSLYRYICSQMGDLAPIGGVFEEKQKLYFYQGKKTFPMLRITFTSINGLQKLRTLTKRPIKFETKDRNRPKLVKLSASVNLLEDRHSPIRRLLTERQCRYAQWFEIKAEELTENKLSTIREWEGDYHTLTARPDITMVTSPKIFSFDIECYSNNHRAMPKEYIPEHVVYMISCVVFRTGKPEREKYLLVLGELEIEGVETICTKEETELCEAFASLINRVNPDIITGYNIFGFDYPYLFARLGLHTKQWPNISRLVEGNNILREINWKSSAYSRQHYYMMDCSGRVNFDLFTLARREMKLLRYNLDTVAKENLGRGKHDISAVEMFSIYERYTSNPEKYKDDFRRVAEYCLEDAMLVVDLIEKLNVWIWLIEFSSVTGVSVADLFIRGQQVRCYSLLQDILIRKGMVMDKLTIAREPYSGAYVCEPISGLYDYVVCLDFNSLYPNIIRQNNMCYTTLVSPEDEKELSPEDVNVIAWEEEDEKTKIVRSFRHVFVKEHVRESLLKELLTDLIDSRKAVRDSMKGDKDPLSLSVKDKKQLGFKVVANSTYGFTGARQGFLPCPQIAASVTAMGRKYIQDCNRYIEEKYGYKVVYNDTDSTFFVVPSSSYTEAYKKGKELEKEVSDTFPGYLNLEMEKVGRMFCIKKKMYAFWGVDREGNFLPKSKIMHKGIVLNRRDNCLWQRNFYDKILMDCLERKNMHEMLNDISEQVIALFSRSNNWSDFVIVKSVGEEYKEKHFAMNIFKENMESRGCPLNAGDRVDFLITRKDTQYLGEKMLAPEHFLLEGAQIDYDYYLTHYGTNNIEKIYQIVYSKEVEEIINKRKEKFAHLALIDFLRKYPAYGEICVQICKENKSFMDAHQSLFDYFKARRIGKIREELRKFYTSRTKKVGSYICKNPVKQQYKLVLLKRKCYEELLIRLPRID